VLKYYETLNRRKSFAKENALNLISSTPLECSIAGRRLNVRVFYKYISLHIERYIKQGPT